MNDIRELKDVLDKIERKLIAASKMYSALNFTVWLVVISLFYVLIPLPLEGKGASEWLIPLYWFSAVAVVLIFEKKTWKMIYRLNERVKKEKYSETFGLLIALSWILGSIVGWGIVPQIGLSPNTSTNFAIGFLSFIAISVFGIWVVMLRYYRNEMEMVPSFIIPAIGIPVAMMIDAGVVWVWSGLLVALGYSITALWELYSAFRMITR